ncbi:hypothetical protein, partial [Oligella urethralis]|uniref:hypothetical protein n=1 Tax=Oligella urethralis TaxID=90245 RepID=UPI0027B9C13C
DLSTISSLKCENYAGSLQEFTRDLCDGLSDSFFLRFCVVLSGYFVAVEMFTTKTLNFVLVVFTD